MAAGVSTRSNAGSKAPRRNSCSSNSVSSSESSTIKMRRFLFMREPGFAAADSRVLLDTTLHQSEVKSRAFLDCAFRPNRAAVTMDDSLDGCQPNSGSFEFGHTMQPLEGAKQFSGVGHVETRAVVAHEIGLLPVVRSQAQFDLRLRVFGGEFPRVTQQVFQR